ncbi:Aste57867_17958 [Aphanomyces stellatus]|uniref:amino-acid N-acetyltransferase n=1 Tax=Aphanomyces stellatus TaxID=120398 RepID=A0A485L9Q3_9STRA|nr:hypothetical protein As57867_017896 [Aphanomyces stellatus]VFT94698.1 Aste57867_17958 [Aphanomyces stellatus]
MKRFLRASAAIPCRRSISTMGMLMDVPPECLKVAEPQTTMIPMLNSFTEMFRSMSPYINVHRGKTMVIHLCGDLIESPVFPTTMQDIALLSSFGIQIILVAGSRPQTDSRLVKRGIPQVIERGFRVTDADVLACAMEAAGSVRFRIESALGRGILNAPGDRQAINISSGNFVLAQPVGVRGGVDYKFSGEVRRVNAAKINKSLEAGDIVLLSDIAYSASGEVFHILSEQIAAKCAVQMDTDKLIFLHDGESMVDVRNNQTVHTLLIRQATQYLELAALDPSINPNFISYLKHATKSCISGVKRSHLVSRHTNGALLQELFTRDGDGIMISKDMYEGVRMARSTDIPSIMRLIQPMLDEDILVSRSQEQIESNVHMFTVVERDGAIIACCTLQPYENNFAEMACVAVDPAYRKLGKGNALLGYILRKASAMGVKKLFVLTTRTSHWFMERGFHAAALEDLPPTKRKSIDPSRQSKVYVMDISNKRIVEEKELLLL